jgi:hypothetical protein
MQTHILVFGFDPIDLLYSEQKDTAAQSYDESLDVILWRHEPLEQSRYVRMGRTGPALEAQPRPVERIQKAFFIEWFQQIVERLYLESFQRVPVVGGHKDYSGHLLRVDSFEYSKPIKLEHLNVQEHQVRPQAADRLNGFVSVGALTDQLEISGRPQHFSYQAAGPRLVVNYKQSQSFFVHADAPLSSGDLLSDSDNGKRSVATSPPRGSLCKIRAL